MAPTRTRGGKGGVGYDVVAPGLDSAGAGVGGTVGPRLAACVFQKGFSVARLGVAQESLASSLREVAKLEAQGDRFAPPAPELADGLLGEEGSSWICELGGEDDLPEGLGLQALDRHLAEVGALLLSNAQPLQEELAGVRRRSSGLLHLAGCPADTVPELTDAECERWLTQFAHHRLMLVLFLGPVGGILELQPLADEEASPLEVPVEPGTTVILRPDYLSHRFTAHGRAVALSCWFNEEQLKTAMREEPAVSTPTYKELKAWKHRRLSALKQNQVIGEEGQEWDPAVPKEWQWAANHLYHMGPQVGTRSLACKLPQSYDPTGFWAGMNAGMDFIQGVPIERWNHAGFYDPTPNSWKAAKTNCNHASFCEGLEMFDCKFFGVSPFEAKGMDPNQRHIMETSYEALQRAGQTKKSLMRSLIGVYIAAAVSEYSYVPQDAGAGATGGANSITSNRISFCLGMQGPSYTLDNQGAASLSALTAAALSLRMQTGRYQPNHMALVGGTSLLLAGQTWILHSSQGWLSTGGRCFCFDASADGYVKGEGAANCVLSPVAASVDGEQVSADEPPAYGTVAATSMMHTGRAASLTAPSGPIERDLIVDALRQAGVAPTDVSHVEAWGEGAVLRDAVEAEALHGALRAGGDRDGIETPLCVASGKTQFGNMWEVVGMAQLIRVLVGQKYGCQAPCLHLNELNAHIEVWSGDEPLLFTNEALSYGALTTYAGISGKSFGGTMAHVMTFGMVDQQLRPPRRALGLRPLAFWPGGGGELEEAAAPRSTKPYCVIGSWSEWAKAQPMEREGADVFGLTVTVGANGFEQLQVLLDGDSDKVLHPAWPGAPLGAAVHGPTTALESTHLRWTLGRPPGSEGAGGPGTSAASAAAAAPSRLALPAGGGGQALALERLGEEHAAPGSRYRVRLRVAGKWRTLEWEKVADATVGDPILDDGKYYVVGDWSGWDFQEMRPAGDGTFSAKVGPMPLPGGDFQIVRNMDWVQTFHPSTRGDRGKEPEQVLGPAGRQEDLCWSLGAVRGEVFAIEFERRFEGACEKMSVTWQRLRRK